MTNVRVVRSLSSSALQQRLHLLAPGEREEGRLQRAPARREAGQRHLRLERDQADVGRARPEHEQARAVALDPVPVLLERARQPLRVLRVHLGDVALVAAEDLLERPAAAHLAVGDDHDVVDRLGDLGEQVARDEHGAAVGGLLAQQPAHPADAGRVEAVGGLVEDQHLGVAEQRGGDREPLAHAHRVALDAAVGGLGQPDGVEHLLDALDRVLAGHGQDAQVVARGAAGVEGGVLEHRADVGARAVEVLVAPAAEGRGPGRRPDQAEQRAQRGRLARAVRARGSPSRARARRRSSAR